MAEVQLPCTARKFAEIAAQIALAKTSPNQREPRQIGPSNEGPLFLSHFKHVLPDGPTARGAATSWRVYLVLARSTSMVLPLVGNDDSDQREDRCG